MKCTYFHLYNSEEEFAANPNYWRELTKAFHLGRIPINQVGLDETLRRSIDGERIENWLSSRENEFRKEEKAAFQV
jgi:hypothetical protein